jgi:hypothetical protein
MRDAVNAIVEFGSLCRHACRGLSYFVVFSIRCVVIRDYLLHTLVGLVITNADYLR